MTTSALPDGRSQWTSRYKCSSIFPLIVVFDLSAIQRDFKIIILQCHNHSTFFLLHILIFLRYSTFFLKHLHRFRNYSPFLLNYVFRFSVILLKFFLNHVLMFLNHSAFFLNHYTWCFIQSVWRVIYSVGILIIHLEVADDYLTAGYLIFQLKMAYE